MKVGILFSGGKDSTVALEMAMEKEDVVCLLSMHSENEESYMFHTPNVALTNLQAEAIGLPLVVQKTMGEKEEELEDLDRLITSAKKRFGLEGIVTGAIESVYQATRIQKICRKRNLWCFNPLWKMDQEKLLRHVVGKGYDVIISGCFAYPFTKDWLGRKIDGKTIEDLLAYGKKHGISPSGEGGEIETTVLSAPFFSKRIEVVDSEKKFSDYSGNYVIKKARLVGK